MPTSCSVIGCNSRGYADGRKFFSFPQLKRSSPKTLALTQARQNAWLVALNRDHFNGSKLKNARVCDLHFVSGRSASYTDTTDPDWIPTKQLGYEISEKALAKAVKKAMNVASNKGTKKAASSKQPIDPKNGDLVELIPVQSSGLASDETQISATTNGVSLFSAKTLSTRCRLCLEESVDLKSMLIPWNNTINLWNMYDYLMNVGENVDSAFVPHICTKCEAELRSAFFFKSMCSETEKTLSEKGGNEVIASEEDDDDVVTQFVDIEEIVESCDGNDGESEMEFIPSEDNCMVDTLMEADIVEVCDANDENFWSESFDENVAVIEETVTEPVKPEVLNRRCKACDVLFENRSSYMAHYRQIHHGTCKKATASKILCSYCGKWVGQHSIGRHMKTSHHKLINEKRYECSICGTKFTKNSNLNRHTRQQHAK